MRIIREIEPLPWLCGIPEVLNWRQQLEYTDVYSIHTVYSVYTQDTFHSRQWKIMEDHTFAEDIPVFVWRFSTKIARSDSPNLWSSWAQHGYWCPARPRNFATRLPKQQRSLADASRSPPDASLKREIPIFFMAM
jgi:hypothetical protein